jgi:DNA-binding SARP family transcriptional activator
LLLEPGRVVSTDHLIDELWATEPPDGAATTIRSYVSRLRVALGDGAPIAGSSVGYRIDVAPEMVDLSLFERAVRRADQDLDQQRVRAARDELNKALQLWRGRPFDGLAANGSLAVEAARLEELRLHAIEQRIDADIALGRSSELIDEVEALVNRHPYRERLWRSLMLALYHSGRQADALEAYQRARQMLDEELGLEPSAEMQALEVAILRQEVPGVARSQRVGNLPMALTSFVGRADALSDLHRTLAEVRMVTLTGVGGVSRSTGGRRRR